ncbi:MAG TPA: thioesterase family protein [Actinomycetota bacterium]|jgi:2-aminobenzoate-CoA ligase
MDSLAQPRPASVVVERRIEWSDTDASGWWHNTAGFRFIEAAETTLLERLGLLRDVYGRLPRVRIAADFKGRLAFRDVVECSIAVREVGTTSLVYDFEMRRQGELAMTAEVVVALLDESWRPVPWPDAYRTLLLTAGPQPPEKLTVG